MKQSQLSGATILMAVITTLAIFFVMSYSLNRASLPSTLISEITPSTAPTQKSTTAPTFTSSPSATLPEKAEPSESQTLTRTPTFTGTACEIRRDWPVYHVASGDTLSQIALRASTTTSALISANCLQTSVIYPWQTLRIPSALSTLTPGVLTLPANSTSTAPGIRPTQSPSDGLCLDADSIITDPPVGMILSGNQSFYGTAVGEEFAFFKLEIRKEDQSSNVDFVTFYTSSQPIIGGFLGNLLTEAFSNGEYWIRLVVVDTHHNYLERCSILYTIQN